MKTDTKPPLHKSRNTLSKGNNEGNHIASPFKSPSPPIMRLQHGFSNTVRRIVRRYPFLRRISLATTFITLLWLYTINWGERSVYETHIDACHWEEWEEWPREAQPHHLVFITDPQLVDPHTYPKRTWPVTALQEVFTDMYMARNYRLINDIIDPDTIIFLGDLFDGGREWAPEIPRQLTQDQRQSLEHLSVLSSDYFARKEAEGEVPESQKFVQGENGRWSKWDNRQWMKDFRRFSKIFFAPEQLYPYQDRQIYPIYNVSPDNVSIQNGADNATSQEYATRGGKQRQVLTSVPGNHDLGFGPGVQVSVRDRFQAHFGESNRIDVIGNHSFVSLDVLSLAAHSYFKSDGFETDVEQWGYQHVWGQGMEFLNNIRASASKEVDEALAEIYLNETQTTRWPHEVTEGADMAVQPPADEKAATQISNAKPNLPVILLSHVPLYRVPGTECGPLRERSQAIRVAMGYQYQNVLTQSLSREVISKVSNGAGDILHAFSGDDHDYCDTTHRLNIDGKLKHVKEITVKTFSWAMSMRRPGFLLVSLWNPVDAQGKTLAGTPSSTIQTRLCLLPDQLNIYLDYGLLLLLTLAVLLVDAVYSSFHLPLNEPADIADERTPSPLEAVRMSLPRFKLAPTSNGSPNVYVAAKAHPGGPATKKTTTRQRGTSTSHSHSQSHSHSHGHSRSNSHSTGQSNNISIQRSFNQRTREVSSPLGPHLHQHQGPSPPGGFQHPYGGPLIDRAGYFPAVKWQNPSDDEDEDSDEEAKLGVRVKDWREREGDDKLAKWKWRRRTMAGGRLRRIMREFAIKFFVVGGVVVSYYAVLVRHG